MLPGEIGEELAGEYLAAFIEDDCIRLEPVRGGGT